MNTVKRVRSLRSATIFLLGGMMVIASGEIASGFPELKIRGPNGAAHLVHESNRVKQAEYPFQGNVRNFPVLETRI